MYEMGFKAMSALALTETPAGSGGAVLGDFVRQVHGDWSPALEAARRKVWPDSVRAADFRHMYAKLVEQLKEKLDEEDSDHVDSYYNQILKAVRRSRTCCATLVEFDLF